MAEQTNLSENEPLSLDRSIDLTYDDRPIVGIEFDADGEPIWITTDEQYNEKNAGWYVLIDGDQILIEDADWKRDGRAVDGVYWAADGYEFEAKAYQSPSGKVAPTRLESLTHEQIQRINQLIDQGTQVEKTMWCVVCEKHTYPEGWWSDCSHHRWSGYYGAWVGVGNSENDPTDYAASMVALLDLCDRLEPARYYVPAHPETRQSGYYKSSPAGRDRLHWVLKLGDRAQLSDLLFALHVDEDEEIVGPLSTWLQTLDHEKDNPQGWALARGWTIKT